MKENANDIKQISQRKMKRPAQSRTEHVQIVFPAHTNGSDRLFGGQLMQWIDIVAAVVARRHSESNVTTACIETVTFTAPAFVDDTIYLSGIITYAGRTSMEVRVETWSETLSGERHSLNTAYLTLVAVDENNIPVQVPGLTLETEEEKCLWDQAKLRRQIRESMQSNSPC
jgi:acyl-CoA hydrolase